MFKVVTIPNSLPSPFKLSLRACAGLLNRSGAKIYVIGDDGTKDKKWLSELNLEPCKDYETIIPEELIALCLNEFPTVVLYSYRKQKSLLPNIITLAATHNAVPIEAPHLSRLSDTHPHLFRDRFLLLKKIYAQKVFRPPTLSTPLAATRYIFQKYADLTHGLAVLNPGYDTWNSVTPWNPPLTKKEMNASFVDYVFSETLFVMYLVNCGIPYTPSHRLLNDMLNDETRSGMWRHPGPGGTVRVYGYADYWLVGGFLFEAETMASSSRCMGSVPTLDASNLSFFSRFHDDRPTVVAAAVDSYVIVEKKDGLAAAAVKTTAVASSCQLLQNPTERIAYDPQMTYVAFVVGDGDNISCLTDYRTDWFEQRVAYCHDKQSKMGDASTATTPPPAALTWTISPHLIEMAPSILQWYYARSQETKCDYFLLPPSGHLYAYPSSLDVTVRGQFIKQTEQDAILLDTKSTVHWDWFTSWHKAEKEVIPKYGERGVINGVFPTNVPFFLPTGTWPRDGATFYKVFRKEKHHPVVLFRPRAWRGVHGSGPYLKSPQEMSNEIALYPKGTVAYVYMTSDQGLTLSNSFLELVDILPPHVRLVSTMAATQLALCADGLSNNTRL
eukprot:CAMPEP_0172483080 /NCGR_PEP_ID=MMETSP1066-20121228/9895_1 /TAXON_ID=671091 /ORGANISM="Coscinodiscus wailesii, Strain CCMP2513" /LENGTH=612 /DNA_ID=CAMNT_0013246735 /DNA_START=39 /DNA_END=1877 /DNA_ORIENTATION=-